MLKNKNSIPLFLVIVILCFGSVLPVFAGDIKPSVEVEFNMFYNKNYDQALSFQFREAKLFLDTYINDHSTALIEYTMKDNLVRGLLERAYFVQHDLPFNGRLTLGQFRNPFGYFDPFTVSHSITKSTPLSPDSAMPQFMLRDLDVGVFWESTGSEFSYGLAIVNGNGINTLKDDNNFKDIIGHMLYSFGDFQVGANGYYGRKNSLLPGGGIKSYSNVSVIAAGIEAMAFVGDATIASEVLIQEYGSLRTIGGYVTMNYDLGNTLAGLRATSRIEAFDPNRAIINNEHLQWSQGFLYSISRGYQAKFELVVNLEKYRQRANEIIFELEYEL